MGNIKIVKGVFDTKLELEHASVVAGFPSPADDYTHETLEFYNVVFFSCLKQERTGRITVDKNLNGKIYLEEK